MPRIKSLIRAEEQYLANQELRRETDRRKHAEEELISLTNFPQENPNPVLRLNAAGKILYKNPAVDRLLETAGLAENEIFRILPANLQELIDKTLKTGAPVFSLEVSVADIYLLYSIMPVIENRYVNLYATNITEYKDLQEELYQADKLSAVGTLISEVAHEINNPLTSISGFAQLLQEESYPQDRPSYQLKEGSYNQKVREDAGKILAEAHRCIKVIENLLDFSRKKKIDKQHININKIIRNAVELKGRQLEFDRIRLVDELAPDSDLPGVLADPNLIRQVFLNIINNAHHAILEERKAGEIRLKSEAFNGRIRISIKDTGPGIQVEDLKRIFEPFFTTKPPGKGTGLGLSISHRIIKEHGGNIYALSEVGKGTTMVVELPVNSTVRS